MQTIELQKMGLTQLQHEQCRQVNGGGFWDVLFRSAIEHYDELAKGLEAGWNFDKPKK
ncbi:MAG TPA: hypothetical protein VK616_11040 [Flavitalea sp.]|nr:hypothetical protein [Flavitalea sp.]